MMEKHNFYTVCEILMYERMMIELGEKVSKFEQQGLTLLESFDMEMLLIECKKFYGCDEKTLVQNALKSYADVKMKSFYEELMRNVNLPSSEE